MDKKVIVSIVIVLLVIISVVQALQLAGLKAKISDVSFGTVKSSSKTVPASGSSSSGGGDTVAANIANLPSMVGGC